MYIAAVLKTKGLKPLNWSLTSQLIQIRCAWYILFIFSPKDILWLEIHTKIETSNCVFIFLYIFPAYVALIHLSWPLGFHFASIKLGRESLGRDF